MNANECVLSQHITLQIYTKKRVPQNKVDIIYKDVS